VYFGYSAAEVIKSNNNSWRSKEEVFLFLDFISAIFWVVCIEQKLAGHLDVTMIGSIPFLLMLTLYLRASAAPRTLKFKGLLLEYSLLFRASLLA